MAFSSFPPRGGASPSPSPGRQAASPPMVGELQSTSVHDQWRSRVNSLLQGASSSHHQHHQDAAFWSTELPAMLQGEVAGNDPGRGKQGTSIVVRAASGGGVQARQRPSPPAVPPVTRGGSTNMYNGHIPSTTATHTSTAYDAREMRPVEQQRDPMKQREQEELAPQLERLRHDVHSVSNEEVLEILKRVEGLLAGQQQLQQQQLEVARMQQEHQLQEQRARSVGSDSARQHHTPPTTMDTLTDATTRCSSEETKHCVDEASGGERQAQPVEQQPPVPPTVAPPSLAGATDGSSMAAYQERYARWWQQYGGQIMQQQQQQQQTMMGQQQHSMNTTNMQFNNSASAAATGTTQQRSFHSPAPAHPHQPYQPYHQEAYYSHQQPHYAGGQPQQHHQQQGGAQLVASTWGDAAEAFVEEDLPAANPNKPDRGLSRAQVQFTAVREQQQQQQRRRANSNSRRQNDGGSTTWRPGPMEKMMFRDSVYDRKKVELEARKKEKPYWR